MPGDVDMKLTKADQKAKDGAYPSPISAGKDKGPKYPWGLEVNLDDLSLKKLGMDGDMPEVGELCQITGVGRIVSVSQRESTMGGSSKSVTIQIERLGLEVKEESDSAEAAEADKAFESGVKKGRGRSTDGY